MVRGIVPDDPYRIWETKALKKPGEAEARDLLTRAGAQVQPIMRKRKWRVPLLQEFEPKNAGLLGLNVNGGGGKTSVIKVRTRRPGGGFFPYEHVLGTLLHELVHNEIGAHSAKFYAMLDEITQECEELMAKGIKGPGQGFDGPSAGRVGGGDRHNPPDSQIKDAVRKAAEERLRRQGAMPSGGRRLGGSSLMGAGLSAAQAAAMAAERRARDNLWCSGIVEEAEPSSGGGAQEGDCRTREDQGQAGSDQGGEEVIDLTGGAAPPVGDPAPRERSPPSGVIDLTGCDDLHEAPPSSRSPSFKRPRPPSVLRRQWACQCCTLLNPPAQPSCEACGAPSSAEAADERGFARNSGGSGSSKSWACTACTASNHERDSNCAACGRWRFSTGAPVGVSALPGMSGIT